MSAQNSSVLSYHNIILSNGASVSYSDNGKGPQTIVFIHGLATFSGTWQKNIDALQHHYRCIAIDLPGNGYSDKKERSYGIHFYAACIYDLIQLLGLKNVVLCGHSMGGQIAMTLLLNAPAAAEKLVLCAPAGFEQFNVFEKTMYNSMIGFSDMFASKESNLRNTIYSSFYNNPAQADGMINEMVKIIRTYPSNAYQKMMESCVKSMMDEPVYSRLGEIKLPVKVIFGDMDALIPNKLLHPGSTEQLAKNAIAKMPGASLKMVAYAGHFVQWEKAEVVNETIASFLKK